MTTQNPNALKFVLKKKLIKNKVMSYDDPTSAASDPLAKSLFQIEGVKSVWYSERFITLEKHDEVGWGKVQKSLVEIMQNFDFEKLNEIEKTQEEYPPIIAQANAIIQTKILPYLINDGGAINIVGFDDHSIKLKFIGACSDCALSAESTLKMIKRTLSRELPEPLEVEIL
jgi:Fe-S cluster biogenesis protein NfuA